MAILAKLSNYIFLFQFSSLYCRAGRACWGHLSTHSKAEEMLLETGTRSDKSFHLFTGRNPQTVGIVR